MNITDIFSFTNVIKLLPLSPFKAFLNAFTGLPYLKYLNWFLPISEMITVGEAWLVAIGLFYLYSIILRWIRAIQ